MNRLLLIATTASALALYAQRPAPAVPVTNEDPPAKIPIGFTAIFNGKDLTGWHVSKTNHHGTSPDYRVAPGGILLGSQNPVGGGGVLLTDKKYKDVEVYLEVKPDWGCDSGMFFRVNEAGAGYQVMLDYLPGGNLGGIYGERIEGVSANPPGTSQEQALQIAAQRNEAWQKAWKREQWNTIRARITGSPPRIQSWINDEAMLDWRDTANHAAGGIEDGPIAIQVHGGNRWRPGGFWRWRVIAVKELP
jgi:hypothetical protein